jgi:phosphatidate cytidylyltransferase
MAPGGPVPRSFGDLGVRLTSGVVLGVCAIGSVRIGQRGFALVWLAAAFAVAWEWQRLIGGARFGLRLLAAGVALGLSAYAALAAAPAVGLALVVLGGLAAAALAGAGWRVWAGAGVAYAGFFLVCLIALRLSFPFGYRVIFWLFAVVWGADVFAYLGGRLIGGPKLWPAVSPGKTWSGTLTGVVCGGALGLLFLTVAGAVTRFETPAPSLPLLMLGLVVAAVSQGGDLFESWVKRRFGVKDSSRLIPGHGGAMDRLDGFIVAVICATIIGALRGFPSAAEGLFHWN